MKNTPQSTNQKNSSKKSQKNSAKNFSPKSKKAHTFIDEKMQLKKRPAKKPKATGAWSEIPHEIRFPEDSFFTTRENISDIQRRLYGLLRLDNSVANLRNMKNKDLKHEQITKIIHGVKWEVSGLAYSSHNGRKWQNDGILKMQKGLLNQVSGGRAMEILLAEAMMRITPRKADGYHFLPEKNMDTEHKIDMMSRIPYWTVNGENGVKETETRNKMIKNGQKERNLSTIGFGTQITMAKISHTEEDMEDTYKRKYQQMKTKAPQFNDSLSREEMAQKFSQINVPDIVSYVAINGSLARKITSTTQNPALDNFRKWRKNEFDTDGLLDYFDKDFNEKILMVANELSETQKMIISKEFLGKMENKLKFEKEINANFKKEIRFSPHTKELSVKIFDKNEVLAKFTFFLSDEVIKKIEHIHNV